MKQLLQPANAVAQDDSPYVEAARKQLFQGLPTNKLTVRQLGNVLQQAQRLKKEAERGYSSK